MLVPLTSLQNPTVRRLVRLRDNRTRKRERRILVDGFRETEKAFRAGLVPIGIYLPVDSHTDSLASQRVIELAADTLCHVSDKVMEKISYGQSPRGVVGEFQEPDWSLDTLPNDEPQLILVLDGLEKPGNIGAAFRSADAVGVDAVILTASGSDRFNPNTIRGSLGAVFTVPSAATDESSARRWLRDHGFQILAARVESARPMWDVSMKRSTAIVIGSEADGLADRWQSDSQSTVEGIQIPMFGSVDSLNAAASAALLLYEAKRQQRSR